MLENSTSPENPGTGDPGSIGSGHRWPRKETFALLDIRSSLDAKFRDSSSKAHLWEEVSRKMGELGFSRSAKKCKEKFENIYKYHKRTKDVRSEKANGKAYRFFDQLEALDHQQQALEIRVQTNSDVILDAVPCSIHKPTVGNSSPSASYSSSSSQESEGTRKKKTKLTHFFERLMKEVAERQECLQRTFVEALEKCEKDRIAREESWKAQELDRSRRETELLVRERSAAAEKDAALLALLKRFADQRSDGPQFPETQIPDLQNELAKYENKTCLEKQEKGSVQIVGSSSSSSRWPKEEVDALIRIRTSLDSRYQDNGSKGPLWEEVSSSMVKLGYDRSSKRCKEKWENINKYFKKVREGSKKRGFDSKTCPYFHQLDSLYSNTNSSNKKAKKTMDSGYDDGDDDDDDDDNDNDNDNDDDNYDNMRPEELLMHMMSGHEERGRVDHESVDVGGCGDQGNGSFEV